MYMCVYIYIYIFKFEKEILWHSRMKKKCIQLRPWKVNKPVFQSLPVTSWLSKSSSLSLTPFVYARKLRYHFLGVDRNHEQTLAQWELSKHGFFSPAPCPPEPSRLGGPSHSTRPTLPWSWCFLPGRRPEGGGSGCASGQSLGTVDLLFWHICSPASCFS